jgi:hypothetical protein
MDRLDEKREVDVMIGDDSAAGVIGEDGRKVVVALAEVEVPDVTIGETENAAR